MGVSLEDGWQPSSRTHHHGTCARVSCRQRAGWSPRRTYATICHDPQSA